MMEGVQANITWEKYPDYKDSGLEYLGEIPSHWKKIRLASFGKFSKGGGFSKSDLTSEGELAILYGDIYTKYDISIKKVVRSISKETSQKSIKIKKGTLLFTGSGETIEDIGKCVIYSNDSPAFAGGDIIIFSQSRCNGQFLTYYLNSEKIKIEKARTAKGEIIVHTYASKLRNLYVPIPPLPEQTAIARFLDAQCAKIDQAIAQKEKLIALLQERKQIMIQQAVTRGLDPEVKMKDSGVEWIGEIPEGWEVVPGFTIVKEMKRNNKGMKENQVLSLSYGKIIIKPEEKLFGLVPESFETYQIVYPGDIIIRCTDLQNDKNSLRTGISINKGIITSAYLNLKVVQNNDPDYVHFFLHALDITKQIYRYGSGLRQNLSYFDFKRMPFLLVPIEEQKKIVEFINKNSQKTLQAINHLANQIGKLKEYKSILINDAVTGKIKV